MAAAHGRIPLTSGGGSPQPDGTSFGGFLRLVKDARSEQVHRSHEAKIALAKVYQSDWQTRPNPSVRKTAMGESSGGIGGFLVPMGYSLAMMDSLAEESFIYPRATIVPMPELEIELPRIDTETASGTAGVPSFFGSTFFSWGSEQAPAETEPVFKQDSLKAWDLTGYSKVSNQWLMDTGPEGEKYLVRLFGRAAAWYSEYAFLQGTGTAQQMPLGMLNAPAAVNASRGGSSHIATADIALMASKLLPFCWQHAIWATSPTSLADITKLSTFIINEGGVADKENGSYAGRLLTRPLFVTDKLPPLGTRGDLVLFDPSLYYIGMRQEVLIDVSEHVFFSTYQTAFRVWFRCDAKPLLTGAITLQDQSTTVGQIVVLT